jgi:CheY-like chemotaxis protein
MNAESNRRILLIDDNASIHDDFKKILCDAGGLSGTGFVAKAAFFGSAERKNYEPFEIDSAQQGNDALDMVKRAMESDRPYATAFVDVRMPPGFDGVETIDRLWKIDADVQCVICTAYADYSWQAMIEKLGTTDRLLILKKPFDPVEVRQMATALTEKWSAARRERTRMREVKRAEQEARIYSTTLMTVNRALESAKASAEALARFRSEFLVEVAQEIRTPATVIVGGAEALENPGLEETDKATEVRSIHENGERVLSILDDVRDLALIEIGAMRVERKVCSPTKIVDEVMTDLRAEIDRKGLGFSRRNIKPIPEYIDSDATRLRRVLTCLLSAVVHMSPGGNIGVTMQMKFHDEWQEPELEISIAGSGLFLSADQQSRMFEARAEDISSGSTRGVTSRLGLALAKRLARLLGGDVGVESSAKMGTCFTVTVKTGDLSDVNMIAEPRGALPLAAPRAQGRAQSSILLDGRILVVEDNRTTQRVFQHLLVDAGAEVSLAENGEVGRDLTLAAKQMNRPFALVLMDMQMPKMDGYAATRELRALGYTGPIVAVTAHCMQGDREKCFTAGCNDFVAKPVQRETFLAVCKKWMASTSQPGTVIPSAREEEIAVESPAEESVEHEQR